MILIFGPISGAHFNPAVTLAFLMRRKISVPRSLAYVAAQLVGLYITAGYWFTSSTSFANPAVTVARSFTDTFSSIDPANAPLFIVAQLIGAVVATLTVGWLWASRSGAPDDPR